MARYAIFALGIGCAAVGLAGYYTDEMTWAGGGFVGYFAAMLTAATKLD